MLSQINWNFEVCYFPVCAGISVHIHQFLLKLVWNNIGHDKLNFSVQISQNTTYFFL